MPLKAVFETTVDQVWSATDAPGIGDKPGDIRWESTSQGMKCYKCIIYETGDITVAGVAGEATIYHTMDGYKNKTVTSDYSAGEPAGNRTGAGILQAIMTDTDRGWIQIKGFATMSIDLAGSPADGDQLTTEGGSDGDMTHLLYDISTVSVPRGEATAGDDSDNEIICDFIF